MDAFITSKSSPVLLSWHVLSTIGFDLCSGCTSTPKKSVFILQLLIRSGFVRKIHGLAIKVYEFWWRLLWRGSGNSAEGQQAYWNMLGPLRWGSSRIISYDDILTKIDLCVSRGTLQQPFSFLDCGGGDGRLSLAITARYQISSSTLVDCSDYMVERARMNLPQSTIVSSSMVQVAKSKVPGIWLLPDRLLLMLVKTISFLCVNGWPLEH